MGLPMKRDMTIFKEAVAIIQAAKMPALKLFQDVQEGARVMERKKIENLDLSYERDRLRWEQIHNDPNIVVIEESNHSVKIAVRTYIKYVQRIVMDEESEDPKIKDLWPE